VTTPAASNDNFAILIGDCRERLRELPDASVHCVVTSPPYFGLRDYGHEGQIGLEETPDEFVEQMVDVFREVRRVLRDDGTLWLNLGDSYARNPAKGQHKPGQSGGKNAYVYDTGNGRASSTFLGEGFKEKDLIGIPWRVALALQADGWYLRQDIIWSKPNPMPESVRDRCTKAHEYIFMLTKSPRYHFDHEAIKEPEVCGRKRGPALHPDAKSTNGNGGLSRRESNGTRNRRSVWTVTTKPFKGAHFATFPPDLIEPCILAGCPSDGTVLDPFGGSGTTAGVALAHGRQAILCELNPDYAEMVTDRIASILDRYGKQWPSNDNTAIHDPEIEALIG
jgi:site-specific DNA-methyltransferase (adenine-specific)